MSYDDEVRMECGLRPRSRAQELASQACLLWFNGDIPDNIDDDGDIVSLLVNPDRITSELQF